jgi:hypothetical protein
MSATATVSVARAAVGALAAIDLVYAVLLARRHRLPEWAFGESSGVWRDWAVGNLLAYTAVQAAVAARPTPAGLRAVALLRGQVVPAHVARSRLSPERAGQSALAGTVNAGVAALAWQAARQLTRTGIRR